MSSRLVLGSAKSSKHGDHLPLYRLEDIFARHGVDMVRSTMWCTQTGQVRFPVHTNGSGAFSVLSCFPFSAKSYPSRFPFKGFFDNIDHSLMMHAVRKHTDCPWVLLYIERWLKAPAGIEDGTLLARDRGTPQGGVISPLLANIFLHHVFDTWISREYPGCPFERYADDVVIHCSSQQQALEVKAAVEARLRRCKLAAHPDKTRIVYCRDDYRRQDHEHIQFDFLGYAFRPRHARNRYGKLFCGFLPAISPKAIKAMVAEMRDWDIHRKSDKELADLSRMFNPIIRGWVAYYGRYYPSALQRAFACLNRRLVRWARSKYKPLRDSPKQAASWLRRQAAQSLELFAHWELSIVP